jgi:hypothetical protein
MYDSEVYELGNVGEDFGLQPIGEDDEQLDDDETFGDTGPLNIQQAWFASFTKSSLFCKPLTTFM